MGAFVAYNYARRHHVMALARLRAAMTMLLINLIIGFSIPAVDWRAHLGGLVAGIAAGFAGDPGRPTGARRVFAAVGLTAIVVAAVALVVVRTTQINEDPSILLR